jgi:hypothetical protein
MMPTFTPDAAATLAPSGTWMSLKRPYNKRTNSGWFVAKVAGVCTCGKSYAPGNEIAYSHGKTSGCYWCCRDVKPTAGDLAGFAAWRTNVLAATDMDVIRSIVAHTPATYREMVATVAQVNGSIR